MYSILSILLEQSGQTQPPKGVYRSLALHLLDSSGDWFEVDQSVPVLECDGTYVSPDDLRQYFLEPVPGIHLKGILYFA